jgi:nucleoid-associated protein YgaU
MVALLVTGQLVEREFAARRHAAREAQERAGEYAALLAPLADVSLPRPRKLLASSEPGEAPPLPDRSRQHVVQPGDTLARLARRFYGTEGAWHLIYGHNRAAIPDPGRLQVGTTLWIPPADKRAGR